MYVALDVHRREQLETGVKVCARVQALRARRQRAGEGTNTDGSQGASDKQTNALWLPVAHGCTTCCSLESLPP